MITGQQILNYRINYLIGEGGMGSVYLATHIQLGRKVAIKALNPALTKNPQIRERFKNEAATLSQLQHPNIVTLYDYLEEENALYLIMEYVEGKPLDEYIEKVSGPIPEEKAIPLFSKLLDGFAYAHSQGVVHRDIKPSNIIITPEGNAKILDFGIAKLLTQNLSLTQTGTRMGTVLYMSPEQVKGEPADRRSDVYSLGVTLFQVLTGRCPYNEQNLSEFAIYNKIVNEPLPQAKSFYPGVSDWMQGILDKATAKHPSDRFQSCQDFRDALLGKATHFSIPTPSAKHTVLQTPGNSQTGYRQENGKATKVATEKKSSFAGLGIALAIFIIIAVITGIFLWSGSRNSPDSAQTTAVPKKKATEETSNSAVKEQPLDGETAIPEIEPEIITDEITQKATLVADNIHLEYEVPGKSPNDSSLDDVFQDNRFVVRIILTNVSSRVSFDGVTIKISYLNSEGYAIGNYLYEHGKLEPGAVERFIVERTVPGAAKVNCTIASAEPIVLNE